MPDQKQTPDARTVTVWCCPTCDVPLALVGDAQPRPPPCLGRGAEHEPAKGVPREFVSVFASPSLPDSGERAVPQNELERLRESVTQPHVGGVVVTRPTLRVFLDAFDRSSDGGERPVAWCGCGDEIVSPTHCATCAMLLEDRSDGGEREAHRARDRALRRLAAATRQYRQCSGEVEYKALALARACSCGFEAAVNGPAGGEGDDERRTALHLRECQVALTNATAILRQEGFDIEADAALEVANGDYAPVSVSPDGEGERGGRRRAEFMRVAEWLKIGHIDVTDWVGDYVANMRPALAGEGQDTRETSTNGGTDD